MPSMTNRKTQWKQGWKVHVPVEAAGTPGESGRPRVATPEPACTRKESACPW